MGAVTTERPIQVSAVIDRGLQALLGQQMADGSWNGRLLASISTTALYVLLKLKLNEKDDRFARAIGWLVAQQNPSGGWGDRRGMPDDPSKSRACLAALRAGLPKDHPAVVAAGQYIAGCGKIKDEPIWQTALAYWGVSGEGAAYRPAAPLPVLYWLANHGPVNPFIRIVLNIDLLMALQLYKRLGRYRAWHRSLEPKVLAAVLRDRQSDGLLAGAWQGTPVTTIDGIGALIDAGYAPDSPVIRDSLRFVEDWQFPEGGIGLSSSMNVWESCLAALVLQASGRPLEGPIGRVLDFLEGSKLPDGTWPWDSRMGSTAYYDTDDTAYAALALWRGGRQATLGSTLAFMRSHQVDGAWATFHRKPLIMINPAMGNCPDVTAHVVSFMAEATGKDSAEVKAAVRWMLRRQERDGSWVGWWYARKTYGTQCMMEALMSAGTPESHPAVRSAVDWLKRCQNADGGWGEDWDGNPAPSTNEHTAYAVHALAVAGEAPEGPAIQGGINFLAQNQNPDGSWNAGQIGTFQDRFSGHYTCENYGTIQALNALIAVERRIAGRPGLYTSEFCKG